MKRILLLATNLTLAIVLCASHAAAQGGTFNQRMYLTFSGTVQVPGRTLPAGTYLFQLAGTTSRSIMQVYDKAEQHLLCQFFFIPARDRTTRQLDAANGKPVVTLRETPEGVPPAIDVVYYPTDLTGKAFLYPKQQAQQLAAATHQPIPSTDTLVDISAVPSVVTILPGVDGQ